MRSYYEVLAEEAGIYERYVEASWNPFFLGGLMSFQNLTRTPKSARWVAHLLPSRKVLSLSREADRIERKLQEVK